MKTTLIILVCLTLVGCATAGSHQQQSGGLNFGELFGQNAETVGTRLNIDLSMPPKFFDTKKHEEYVIGLDGGKYLDVELKSMSFYFSRDQLWKIRFIAVGYNSWLAWRNILRSGYKGDKYTYYWWFRDATMTLSYDEEDEEARITLYSPKIDEEKEKSKKKE